MTKWDSLSLFLPAYNEEGNIKNTAEKAYSFLKTHVKDWEMIIVNDGSKDKTGAIADSFAKKDKRIRVIHNHPNLGYGGALKVGFYNSRKNWIAFTDGDGQFDITELELFFDAQKKSKADVIIGFYLSRAVTKSQIITSKIWEFIVFILFGLKVKDIDCAMKLIRRQVIQTIPKLESTRGAFISSELLIKVKRAGFSIREIGVHHYPRTTGSATNRDISVIVQSFVDLFRLWWKLAWVE